MFDERERAMEDERKTLFMYVNSISNVPKDKFKQ